MKRWHVIAGALLLGATVVFAQTVVYQGGVATTVMGTNVGVPAGGYLSFGTTYGEPGYGVRDNAGSIEIKDSGGSWGAPGGGSGDVTGPGSSTDGNVAVWNGADGDTLVDGWAQGQLLTDGDSAAPTAAGLLKFDPTAEDLVVGDGASSIHSESVARKGVTEGYPWLQVGTGAPSAGGSSGPGIYIDTTTADAPEVYGCGPASETCDLVGPGDGIVTVVGDTGSVVCTAPDCQSTTAGGGGISTAVTGTSPNITTTVTRAGTRSIFFTADSFYMQGTCTLTTDTALIGSGLVEPYITCTDADTAGFHRGIIMPDSWNAGTVTFEVSLTNVNATPADNYEIDLSGECESPNEVIATSISITGEQPATFDFDGVTGGSCDVGGDEACAQNALVQVTTAAVTLNGSCAAGELLRIQGQIDATATTTAQVANVKIIGVKMEYGVSGAD